MSVPGWKIGYCLAPEPIMSRFREVHRYQIYSVNLPIQLALADFLNGKSNWAPFREEFQQRRDLFASLMKGSKFNLLPVQGGYFQVMGYENISKEKDVDFCNWLAETIGVTAFPLSLFYHDSVDNQRMRICFGKSEDELRLAASRLVGL
jgi:methionine aminotransferase